MHVCVCVCGMHTHTHTQLWEGPGKQAGPEMSRGSRETGARGTSVSPSRFGLTQAHPIHPCLEASDPEGRPMSQAFTHAFLLCWGWKRTCSRKPLTEMRMAHRDRFHWFSEMWLLFPFSYSVCGWCGGVQYGAHWDLMARRRGMSLRLPHNNPDSSQRVSHLSDPTAVSPWSVPLLSSI